MPPKRGDWKGEKLKKFWDYLRSKDISPEIIQVIQEKKTETPTNIVKYILPFLNVNFLLEQNDPDKQEQKNIYYCDVKQLTECMEELKSFEETKIRKVFSDPIHGQFEVHPACEMIIDTPQIQRLRFLKKIGTCHFVFPGASHSRFELALGVCHLAGKCVRALRQKQPYLGITYEDMLCVEIGGLCCSLGYGPFSRLYEESFLPQIENRNSLEKRTIDMFDLLLKQSCTSSSMKEGGTQQAGAQKGKTIKDELIETYGLKEEDITFIREMISCPQVTGSTAWPYVGRKQHKSFLYEIVYNKRNNIDAYRWDYLARDCYHLGLKNNFDHLRYIQMARVLEVDGELQICMRDKEIGNLHNYFYTRYTLMRTAYNHKVNCAIELMICDAMLKAKDLVTFRVKNGDMNRDVKLSECHTNIEAYQHLTDNVIFQICYSKDDKLKEAKDLIERVIQTRELYTCVFESEPFHPDKLKTMMTRKDGEAAKESQETFITKKILANVKEEQTGFQISIEETNFKVQVMDLDFGMMGENPIERLKVYSKRNVNKGQHPTMISRIFSPQIVQEKAFRVFSRNREENVCKMLNEASKQFLEDLLKNLE